MNESLSALLFSLSSLLFIVAAGSAAMALAFSTLGWIAALLLRSTAAPLRHNLLLLAVLLTLVSPFLAALAYQQGWGGLIWKRPSAPAVAENYEPENVHWLSVKSPILFSPAAHPAAQETPRPAPNPALFQKHGPWIVPSLWFVWLTGALFGLMRLASDLIGMRRFKKALIAYGDPALELGAPRCEIRWGRSMSPPRIVTTSLTAVPMVVGIRKPVIALPAQIWDQWTPAEKEAVLLHETAHIRRHDPLLALLARLARILFWWCAPLHAAVLSLNRLREQICDDHVRFQQGHGKHLALAMVHLVEHASRTTDRFHPQALAQGLGMWGANGWPSDLEVRLLNLLNSRRKIMTRMSMKSSWVLGGFCLLALPAGIALQIGAQEPEPRRSVYSNPIKDLTSPPPPAGNLEEARKASMEHAAVLTSLRKLVGACRAHAAAHQGEWPATLADVQVVLNDAEQMKLPALQYTRPAKPNENPQTTAVLVETKEGQPDPLGATAFADGHLEFNTAQIEVVVNLLEATKPLPLKEGTAAKPAKDIASSQPVATVNAVLSQDDLRLALSQALSDKDANMLSLPRMTLLEKQTCTAQVEGFVPKDAKYPKTIEGLTFADFLIEVTPRLQQDQILLSVHSALSRSQKQADGTAKKLDEFDLKWIAKVKSGETVYLKVEPEKGKPGRYLFLTATTQKTIPGPGK